MNQQKAATSYPFSISNHANLSFIQGANLQVMPQRERIIENEQRRRKENLRERSALINRTRI